MPISIAEDLAEGCANQLTSAERNNKLTNVNLAGIGVITAWGVARWDYFSNSPQSKQEHWFQNDTKSGGADKLGHLYASYVTTHGLSFLYKDGCFSNNDAALYGALSSFIILSYMEVGDSFSDFGFSWEDMLINGIGVLFGYYSYKNPELANKIDLRWEYGYHPDFENIFTDYENSKYLLALKLNGFKFARTNFLKHIEIHLGYYTRGFDDPATPNQQKAFIGIGVNLTDYFRRRSWSKTATFFRYFQLDGTNVEFDRNLND